MRKAEREKWKRYIWERVAVNPETMCWEWQKALTHGYGELRFNGKTRSAHRVSFHAFGGKTSKTKPFVLHACDNPMCVSPAHLSAGSAKDNMRDMYSRGRAKVLHGEGSPAAKLSKDTVAEILNLCSNDNVSYKEIGERYGVSSVTVSQIARNVIWREIDREPLNGGSRKKRLYKINYAIAAEMRQALLMGSKVSQLAALYGVSVDTVKLVRLCKVWAC